MLPPSPTRVILATAFAFFALSGRVFAQERLCDPAFEDCRSALWTLIDSETVGIDVAFWFMQDTSYATKLINKHNAGVKVRVIVDPRANPTYAGNQQVLDQLQAAGIPMRYKPGGGILHWKMMLFAGQNKLEFSGANYSAGFFNPWEPYVNYFDEAIYFTDDPSVVNSFKTKYDDSWTDTVMYANYANISGPLTRRYPTYPINPELNFPPSVDDSQDFFNRTQARLNAETQKVDVIMYRITNQRYTDTTIDAVRRGIPVRLLHEPNEYRNPARQWDSWNVDRLYMAGIQIKMRKHQGLNHEKAVILYNQGMTIFGSSNWTGPSSNSQAEHNYFTTKSGIFQWFVNHFERKWNSASEYEPFVPLFPNPPSYIAPANAATAQPTTIQLRWEGGPWAHKYDIYFGTSPSPPLYVSDASTAQSGAVSGQPRLDSGSVDDGVTESYTLPITLQAGTTYYWRIVGKTMANKTAGGPTWSFTTAGSQSPPSAPSGLNATAVSPTQINLAWNDVAAETGFRIERSPNGNNSWTEIGSVAANIVSFSDQQVSPQQTYYYRVRAVNSGGFSPYSNTANATTPQTPPPSSSDVVLWASEAPVKIGNWSSVTDSSAAGGSRIFNPDAGASKLQTALTNPAHYFEINFNAGAGINYRLWMRSKAQNDFWGNDSVFVQFSDSVNSSGSPIFRIGTTSATEYNLEDCSGCGIQGWGWQDNGWGIGVLGPLIRFQSGGTHTIRVQVREDGLSIDQIVLSSSTYLNTAPGPLRNDSTILPKSTSGPTNPPTVTSVSPNSGSTSGGTSVVVSGSGFASGAAVSFGGALSSTVSVVSSSSINAITPAHPAGLVDIVVTNPDSQTGTLVSGFSYASPPLPPPSVAAVTPNSGSTNGGTGITISGSNFRSGATVRLGGTLASNVAVASSSSITAFTAAHTAGTVDVVVTNTDGQSGTLPLGFTYTAPQPPLPLFGHVFLVVLENQSYESLIGSSSVPYLNTLANRYGLATNYYANTQPSIGNYFWLTTGQVITNDSNFSGTVTADNLARQLTADAKTWKSYAESLPAPGYTGGDQYPYVKRHNPFAYFSDVLNSPAQAANLVPFSQFSSDLSNNVLPYFSLIIPNQFNNGHDCPQSIPSCTNTDKLINMDNWLRNNIDSLIASPAFRQDGLLIISFDESVGSDTAHGGGHIATVVISSKAKQAYRSTAFYQHESALRLIAEGLGLSGFPGAAAGAANMAEFFGTTPNTAPLINSISPQSGPISGGTSVTLSGTAFSSGATVRFGGSIASAINVIGSTTIIAQSPAHASGSVDVTVTDPDGQSATLASAYTYSGSTSPPVVASITPNSGPTAGGTSVTVSGSQFSNGATVSLGGIGATNVVVVNSSTITARTPAHATGTVDVVVTNADGQSARLTNGFTFGAATSEIVLLADDFNNGSLNTTSWSQNNLFSGYTDATIAVVESQSIDIGPLRQNLDGSHYNGIRSTGSYDFTGAYAYVQITQAPSSSTSADAFFTLGLSVDNFYRIYVEAGSLILQSKINGVKRTLLTTPFNSVNHAFWRIRHDPASGNVVFETAAANSQTPGSWQQVYSETWNTGAVPLTAVMFELKAGTWKAETNAPGSVRFDNFKAAKP